MMISILQVVILPIVLGIILNSLFEAQIQKVVKILPIVSVLAIILILGGVVAVSSQRVMETGLLIMLVVMCHNLLGYGIGFLLAKACHMNIAKAKAISIEVGMQNSGLATSLAMLHFGAVAAFPEPFFRYGITSQGHWPPIISPAKSTKKNRSSLSGGPT